MRTVVIQLSDEDAEQVAEHARTHRRMMITSTVPALHSWDFETANMAIVPGIAESTA